MKSYGTDKTPSTDAAEGVLDDDATPASSDWASFDEEEFLKGEKGGKRDADTDEDETDEEDNDMDGFGFDDEDEEA